MAKIKLYVDEDLTYKLARVLRSRGYDVISAHEAGMRGKKDDEQLEYSTRHGRVVLTATRDILCSFRESIIRRKATFRDFSDGRYRLSGNAETIDPILGNRSFRIYAKFPRLVA